MTYILDTTIITAILKGNENVTKKVRQIIIEGRDILINGISYYEIKRGLVAVNATNQLSKFDSLCQQFGLVFLNTRAIFDMAANIYASLKQKGRLIGDADILIGSVAKSHDFILVTSDLHFQRIQDLKIENWLN